MPGSRVEVWCEDRRHEQFARELLSTQFSVHRKRMNIHVAPRGEGSAAQWVIKQYQIVEARAHAVRHQERLGFLVMVDGDQVGRAKRMQGLCGGPDRRERADRIAICIPTWSIETWVLWLTDGQRHARRLDEKESYRNVVDEREYGRLVRCAVQAWDPPRPEESATLPSLDASRVELRRLPPP
jgi:hypothetical protein